MVACVCVSVVFVCVAVCVWAVGWSTPWKNLNRAPSGGSKQAHRAQRTRVWGVLRCVFASCRCVVWRGTCVRVLVRVERAIMWRGLALTHVWYCRWFDKLFMCACV